MKTIKGFEGEDITVSDFGEWVGKDYIDYKFEYENNNKIIKELERENKKYKEKIEKAIDIAYQYGQIDGGHHKIWTIDQMVRQLLGNKYDNFVKEYEEGGEYSWNTGIAP